MAKIKAEYIWIDGHEPTSKLRSKTKIIDGPVASLDQVPEWGFDGSSTNQAVGRITLQQVGLQFVDFIFPTYLIIAQLPTAFI